MPDTLAGPVPWLLAAPAADSADSARRARRCRRPGPAAAAVVKAPLVGRREAGGRLEGPGAPREPVRARLRACARPDSCPFR